MKKLLLSAILFAALFSFTETKAQVRFNLNINLGRPAWGLPGNYAGDYYYLPEIDCYYDIPRRQFIYFDGGGWAFAAELPYAFRGYDLYHGYKVLVNEPRPYLRCNYYRERYRPYYNTYRAPVMVAPGNRYGYDNDRYERYNRGRDRDHFDRGRGHDRDDDDDHDHGRRGRE